MGMYTAFHFNAELKVDVPNDVVKILQYLADSWVSPPSELPNHPFFSTSRWRSLFACDSAYFPAAAHARVFQRHEGAWFVNVTSNLKNYDGEISKFVDWIMPYIEADVGDFLGYRLYEEHQVPTLIHFTESTEDAAA